jgi:hypothetical protein
MVTAIKKGRGEEKSFGDKKMGAAKIITAPMTSTRGIVYSDVDDQRIPNATVGW